MTPDIEFALLGLPLETARTMLSEQGIGSEEIVVRETMPPRPEKATGQWRVLSCQVSETGIYEIVAAREQLYETHHSQNR